MVFNSHLISGMLYGRSMQTLTTVTVATELHRHIRHTFHYNYTVFIYGTCLVSECGIRSTNRSVFALQTQGSITKRERQLSNHGVQSPNRIVHYRFGDQTPHLGSKRGRLLTECHVQIADPPVRSLNVAFGERHSR